MAQRHDAYGKQVLRQAAGRAFRQKGPSVEIDYGGGGRARIDGTIKGEVACEVESRVGKQVRGAVLDLLCHSLSKKLLLILPVHMNDPAALATQCENILDKFMSQEDFRVVVLTGHGSNPRIEEDVRATKRALRELGVLR